MPEDICFVYNDSDDGFSNLWCSDDNQNAQKAHSEEQEVVEDKVVLEIFHGSQLLNKKIASWEHTPWKEKTKILLGRSLLEGNPAVLIRAKKLVEHYEHLNRISLLELAAWKACCLKSPPKTIRSYVGWQQWVSGGWERNKRSFFRCNDIVIIVEAVLPFLI